MPKKRILIVEDEKDMVDMLVLRLETSGYETLIAYDGEEALQKARAEKPDLILMDVMMPKLNGYQVCRELKNAEETKAISIIMLTAKSQESDKFWGKEVGADDYITKPFESPDLLRKIAALIGEEG